MYASVLLCALLVSILAGESIMGGCPALCVFVICKPISPPMLSGGPMVCVCVDDVSQDLPCHAMVLPGKACVMSKCHSVMYCPGGRWENAWLSREQ